MTLGRVWAVCDHREQVDGQPVPTSALKRVCGVTRAQLRAWERDGRLDVYYAVDASGTRQKAYLRPKERDPIGDVDHERT